MTVMTENEYTIQQVAEIKRISAHTLRYYEKIGLLEPIGRHDNGHRRYHEVDLGWIDFLKLLRETGMPVQQMKEFMDLARAGDPTIPQRVRVLSEHRARLSERIAELSAHLDHLDRKIEFYQGLLENRQTEMCE
jgi:DNA-binding transcriptional MerR regulator